MYKDGIDRTAAPPVPALLQELDMRAFVMV